MMPAMKNLKAFIDPSTSLRAERSNPAPQGKTGLLRRQELLAMTARAFGPPLPSPSWPGSVPAIHVLLAAPKKTRISSTPQRHCEQSGSNPCCHKQDWIASSPEPLLAMTAWVFGPTSPPLPVMAGLRPGHPCLPCCAHAREKRGFHRPLNASLRAKRSEPAPQGRLDCFVARAPRNDGAWRSDLPSPSPSWPGSVPAIHVCSCGAPKKNARGFHRDPQRHCERSEAIQGNKQDWIASSQELLAMTARAFGPTPLPSPSWPGSSPGHPCLPFAAPKKSGGFHRPLNVIV